MKVSNTSKTLSIGALGVAVLLVVLTVGIVAWGDASDWTEAAAAAGIGATVIAVGVLLASSQGWTNGRSLSLAAVATAVVGFGAIGLVLVTYAGSSGKVDSPAASTSSDKTGDQDTVVSDPEAGEALTEQVSNNEIQEPGAAHDVGNHPSFNDFIAMDEATVLRNSPGGAVAPGEVEIIQEQLAAARAFAEAHNTVEKAQAAGFFNTTNDVPFMGAHFINSQYLSDGVFDPARPEGLLFSKLGRGPDAEWQLVGVWYLLFPGINPGITGDIPPEGFAGNLDLWHEHNGLCTRGGTISEGNSAASCQSAGDRFIGDLRWMMHVWVWPEAAENYDGVFAYLNQNLWNMQQNVRSAP